MYEKPVAKPKAWLTYFCKYLFPNPKDEAHTFS